MLSLMAAQLDSTLEVTNQSQVSHTHGQSHQKLPSVLLDHTFGGNHECQV